MNRQTLNKLGSLLHTNQINATVRRKEQRHRNFVCTITIQILPAGCAVLSVSGTNVVQNSSWHNLVAGVAAAGLQLVVFSQSVTCGRLYPKQRKNFHRAR